jgi:two-component system, NarL family, nitrate/nitrite response regulator NarL
LRKFTTDHAMQILLVDDHPLFREGLANVLVGLAGESNILVADDAVEGVAVLQREPAVGLVLLDGNLPKMNGVRAIPLVRQLRPQLPIIMISANERREDIRAAMRAGANGYLSKAAKSAEILEAIRVVMSGARYLPAFMTDIDVGTIDVMVETARGDRGAVHDAGCLDAFGLTIKQIEVLAAICEGLSNKAIAERLAITENTVKVHVAAVFTALRVKSRTQALLAARAQGFTRGAADHPR